MTINYLKKAPPAPAAAEAETRSRVRDIITDIENGGEDAVRRYVTELDKWTGDIVVSAEARRAAADKVSAEARADIEFALKQVRRFAEAQKASLSDFQTELHDGVMAGQKHIPVQTAGCYVPGGRYAHIASAVMSTATARAAGAGGAFFR